MQIKNNFSTPCHQYNGQVEAVNKVIKKMIQKRLEGLKGAWPEEIPGVLWSYRITHRTVTGETPFSLAYGDEAAILVEIGAPSYRVAHFDAIQNEKDLRIELDLLDKKRHQAELRNIVYN